LFIAQGLGAERLACPNPTTAQAKKIPAIAPLLPANFRQKPPYGHSKNLIQLRFGSQLFGGGVASRRLAQKTVVGQFLRN
jgi:hypothetical protein